MKIKAMFVVFLAASNFATANSYTVLINEILKGNVRTVKKIISKNNDWLPHREPPALVVSIKSLGDEMVRYEQLLAQPLKPATNLIAPLFATVLALFVANEAQGINCQVNRTKVKTSIKQNGMLFTKSINEKKENTPIPTNNNNKESFSHPKEETPNFSNLYDSERKEWPEFGSESTTFIDNTIKTQTVEHDEAKQRLVKLMGYAPWAVGGLWLLPQIWNSWTIWKCNAKRKRALRTIRASIDRHTAIVHHLMQAISRTDATQLGKVIQLLHHYQSKIHTKIFKNSLINLEIELGTEDGFADLTR